MFRFNNALSLASKALFSSKLVSRTTPNPGIVSIFKKTMSTKSSLDLRGVYPPIVTPFNADESVAYDKLEHNLKLWGEIPFRGYVVQGTTGEYVFMTAEERVEFVAKVRQMTPKHKLVIAGSGCESTAATVQMSRKMAEAGADAVLVVTPCYYKALMSNEAQEKHFTRVADESPVPVILYSVPSNTGIDLAPEVVVKLSSHPNVIGMKDSSGDITKIASMIHQTREQNFQLLAGSAGFLLASLSVGAVGGVLGLANVLGRECCHLHELYEEGKHTEARHLQHQLIAPNTALTKKYGPAAIKQVMDWCGFYGGPLRAPLLSLSDEEAAIVKLMFVSGGWLSG